MLRDRHIARYNHVDPSESRLDQISSRIDYRFNDNFTPTAMFDSGKRSRTSAVQSLYQGNNRHSQFTSYYSNVWTTTNNMMFNDTQMSTEVVREDREA